MTGITLADHGDARLVEVKTVYLTVVRYISVGISKRGEGHTKTPTLSTAYTYAKARAIGSREALNRATANVPMRMAAVSQESQATEGISGEIERENGTNFVRWQTRLYPLL